ncbi:MAG: hypothetical protein ABIQ41_06420, partial [Gemmatimonadales bacterium]
VADRLIERQQGGEEMLGLAIAWHCMRSKRVQEAGKWLIAGGREAIARSALAEAEAALESGYRNLAMPFRMECGALLTEVLIDQGRYLDSHRLASALSESAGAARDFRVESLLHLSSLALAVAHPSRHEGTLEALLAIASAAQPPDHRLRAATIATALASSSLGNSHLASALGMLSASLEGCPPKQADRYNLMRAQVFYLLRRIGEAEEILARLDALPAKDGPALYRYHLQTGIYNCKVSRGDYADAVACAQQALSIALRAGSPAKERATAANLAVIFLRLGRMEDAYRLACHARDLNAVDEPSTVAVGCLGVELCCLALAGRARDFELALARGRLFTAGDVNPAIVAVTRLWIADALHLSNRTHEAYEEARVGLATFEAVPVGYLGIAARWAANMHRNHPDPRWTSTLGLAMSHLEAVDMLDRLEITLGALRTLELDSETTTKLRHIAHLATQSLPTHAIWMVGRLGLPYGTLQHLPQNTHPTA